MDAMRLLVQEEIQFEVDVRYLVCLTRLATCSEPLAIHTITQFPSSERYQGWKTDVLSLGKKAATIIMYTKPGSGGRTTS